MGTLTVEELSKICEDYIRLLELTDTIDRNLEIIETSILTMFNAGGGISRFTTTKGNRLEVVAGRLVVIKGTAGANT